MKNKQKEGAKSTKRKEIFFSRGETAGGDSPQRKKLPTNEEYLKWVRKTKGTARIKKEDYGPGRGN